MALPWFQIWCKAGVTSMGSVFAGSRRVAVLADRVTGFMASVAFGIMSVLVIGQVLSRSFFGYSFQWAEELARYFFIWSTMLASACALYSHSHVGVDLLVNRLGVRNKNAVKIFAQLLLIVALIVMVCAGSLQTWNTALSGQTATSFPVSAALLYLSVPVSGILMLCYAVLQLVELIHSGTTAGVQADSGAISQKRVKGLEMTK